MKKTDIETLVVNASVTLVILMIAIIAILGIYLNEVDSNESLTNQKRHDIIQKR
ncbi:hypothetical protein N9043_01035 [bacterium]|nr:hypothetical protein [bacterium]